MRSSAWSISCAYDSGEGGWGWMSGVGDREDEKREGGEDDEGGGLVPLRIEHE